MAVLGWTLLLGFHQVESGQGLVQTLRWSERRARIKDRTAVSGSQGGAPGDPAPRAFPLHS